AIAGLHGDRQLWIFKLLSEGPALVRLEEIPERDVHALPDGLDGEIDVAEPLPHGILVVPKQRTGRSLLMIIGPAPAPARCGQAPAQASAAQSTNDCFLNYTCAIPSVHVARIRLDTNPWAVE